MMSPTPTSTQSDLYFGTLLSALYLLSGNHFSNRQQFFCNLFASYIAQKSNDLQIAWEPASNSVSLLMRDRQKIPTPLFRHYFHEFKGALKSDVSQYVSMVVATEKNRILHHHTITKLVLECTNITGLDKEYILTHTDKDIADDLTQLVYNALYILYQEPFTRE